MDRGHRTIPWNCNSSSREYKITLWTNPICEKDHQLKWGLGGNWKSYTDKYKITLWTNPTGINAHQLKWGLGGNWKRCTDKYKITLWTNPTGLNAPHLKWGLGGWHVWSSSWATVTFENFFFAELALWDMYEVNLAQYVAAAMQFLSRIGHCFQIILF